jgi:micrococcal nuclease
VATNASSRAIVAAVLAATAVACTPLPQSPAAPAPSPTATVLRTVDGDTIDVIDDNRGRLRVRVLGLDAPELHRPGWSVGCWSQQAADYADQMLTGQRVALVADPTQDSRDKYGRSLFYVEKADGWNYSVEAVRAGMARSYVFKNRPVSLYPDIVTAEDDAKAAQRGLWGPPCNGHVESVPL